MRVKLSKGERIFLYNGDLDYALIKAKEELERKKSSSDYTYLPLHLEKAQAAYDKFFNRINVLEDFIRLAEEELSRNNDSAE